jgi:hypothetical protein
MTQAGQPSSIKPSSVANPSDDWLPEPEARDGEHHEESGHDHGVGDGGAPMNAPARPEVTQYPSIEVWVYSDTGPPVLALSRISQYHQFAGPLVLFGGESPIR